MAGTFKIFLKANERFFINGAVFRVDRKVSIELLNDVDFLLESHVLQAEDATTPLRQLYFIVQVMVISPKDRDTVTPHFRESLPTLLNTFDNQKVLSGLKHVDQMVGEERYYEALKAIRGLYDIEAEILAQRAEPLPVKQPVYEQLRNAS
jgi:flagellar protein FlbT